MKHATARDGHISARVRAVVTASLVWCAACGDDTATGAASAGTATAAGDDASVSDTGITDAADAGVTDSTSADGQQTDTPGTDIAPVDTGLPATLTGTWLECAGTLTLTHERTWSWTSRSGCTHAGEVAWTPETGAIAFAETATPTCAEPVPTWLQGTATAASDGQHLSLINPALFQGWKRLSHSADRQRWVMSAPGKGVGGSLSLCFDEGGHFFDGNWKSADCNLIACGALVTQVKPVGNETHIWTTCTGSCPCAAVIIVQSAVNEMWSGHYQSSNCAGADGGPFTATAEPFVP